MAGESQREPEGRADPTVLTTEALERGLKQEREYAGAKREAIVQRLDAMDMATALLAETVNRVPTEMQKEIGHLLSLVDERFASVQTQFKERDTRQERESRDNKVAVDAAFAAQKEAAASADKANREQNAAATQAAREAIDKSEKSTAETIKTNQELGKSTADSQGKQLDEVKDRLTRLESEKRGQVDNSAVEQARAAVEAQKAATVRAQGMAIVFALISIVGIAVTIVLATRP